MSEPAGPEGLSRRALIKAGVLAAGAAAVLPTRPGWAQLKNVPRNRTLTLVWIGSREGRWVDYELWNPYAIGANHQNGPGIFYEPLAYYSAFADKEYLWLAEGYRYSGDFRELTIKTTCGIRDDDWRETTAAISTGRLQIEPLITHRFAAKDALDGFALLHTGKPHSLGIVLDWSR